MLESGIAITTALEAIARDQKNIYFQAVILKILERINKGRSFASCIYDFPDVFNKIAFLIILAGETNGKLPIALDRLASYFDQKEKLARKLQSAMVYPLFVLAFMVFIIFFIMNFVVPRFKMLLEEYDGQIPAFTQSFLNIYDILQLKIVYILSVFAIVSILSLLAYTRTVKGHYIFSKIKLHLPLLGNLFVQSFIVIFCKTMSTLLAGGVSIIEIFDILTSMTNNDVIKTAIIRTKNNIIEGSNIYLSAAATGFFPGLVIKMMQAGEENGSLAQVLDRTAEHYERKVDAYIASVSSILEPVMIIAAGAIVMIVVIALYLPIFAMPNSVGS